MTKKNVVFLFALIVLMSSRTVLAKNSISGQSKQENTSQSSIAPTSSQIRNENQVTTQNQGENTQLKINTQEQESTGEQETTPSGGIKQKESPRSQTAILNMSIVAQKVQELLTTVGASGGIGDQIREIARNQNQSQTQIQEQLNKLDSRSRLTRIIAGTDLKVIKNLKAELIKNQVRIEQLTKLQTQLTNQEDIIKIQETIQALAQENTTLQERITSEENSKSLLGWLFKFFDRD